MYATIESDQDQIARLETRPKQSLLGEISDIHNRYGLDFPIDECGTRFEDCMDIIKTRMEIMPRVRHDTEAAIRTHFGEDSDEANAAKIVAELGDDLDGIFFNQLLQKNEDAKSWREYSPSFTGHLLQTLDELLNDHTLEGYFHTNGETKEMLSILRALASLDDKDMLGVHTAQLEKLAISQYQQRKPVLLFVFSDWYLRPNRDKTEEIQILEPDCRLILPYNKEVYASVNTMVTEALTQLTPYYPDPEWDEIPTGIIGDGVMWAGSQVVSYTVGEGFDGHGFMLVPNLLKTIENTSEIFERAGLPVPDDLIIAVLRQYIYHELGHTFFSQSDKFLDEMTTDLTTVILFLKNALGKRDEELTNAIAILLGEYRQYVAIPQIGEANSDGYRISSVVVTDKLLEYKLVQVLPDGGLHIHQNRENCILLIEDLTRLHNDLIDGIGSTRLALRSIQPSDIALQITGN